MTSILCHSAAHFTPAQKAYYEHASAGRIAKRLYSLLSSRTCCRYFGLNDRPYGLKADLLISVPTNFKHLCTHNQVSRKILFCDIATEDREVLSLADAVIFVGNRTTIKFFPPGFEDKIQIVNYGCDACWFEQKLDVTRANEFIHFVTEASERKGFFEVMKVWKTRPEKLHILGYMNDPQIQALFRENNHGQMVFHDYTPNDQAEFVRLLKSSRFGYVPTRKEGQVGSVMEAMFSGLLMLTTLESGLDERVLEHTFITRPTDTETQNRYIDQMFGMGETEYTGRQEAMLRALHQYQTWETFDKAVCSFLPSA
jgi:hypothetical protein